MSNAPPAITSAMWGLIHQWHDPQELRWLVLDLVAVLWLRELDG